MPKADQNCDRNGHTSDGIHEALCPESVGEAVCGPSKEHQMTASPVMQPL
jgi:hypothetical protein